MEAEKKAKTQRCSTEMKAKDSMYLYYIDGACKARDISDADGSFEAMECLLNRAANIVPCVLRVAAGTTSSVHGTMDRFCS